MADSSEFTSLIGLRAPIREALALMGATESNKFIAGIAVVVDGQRRVVGVVTDGDIRRGLSRGVTIDEPVEVIANLNPLILRRALSHRQMRQELLEEARRRDVHYVMFTRLVLTDDEDRFVDVIPLSDIMEPQIEDKIVAVYGMGFVGLTLACTLAKAGLAVIGIDSDPEKIAMLDRAEAPFYEKGLDSLLSALTESNPIRYSTDPFAHTADIHIVSVGSPVGPDHKPQLGAVENVSRAIAQVLKQGDLVVFRSTLPVGTMRDIVKPCLEDSGLIAGRDFQFAFAPERTVEGQALEELGTLPQIVGGFDKESTDITAKLFSRITNSIVEVESLEAAELVKLANNTFRDLVFAFANELASVCDTYNINAFRLIQAANEGYPRNAIPSPSPGVGGLCLSKDPYLYGQPLRGEGPRPQLGTISRRINGDGHNYVISKLTRFAVRTGRTLDQLRILIVGLAFKGTPETSDHRNSVTISLIEALPNRSAILVKDFIVAASEIVALGCSPVDDLPEAIGAADAVLVMNNHYLNNRFNIVQALMKCQGPVFFFDGWNQFDQREIEKLDHVTYATMGYETGPQQ